MLHALTPVHRALTPGFACPGNALERPRRDPPCPTTA
jgi:hypothetical protein